MTFGLYYLCLPSLTGDISVAYAHFSCRVWRLCTGILLFALYAVPAARAGEDAFMPADQIKRGMSGYGLSVFQGVEIDTFGVEIPGVMQDAIGPGHDLILARSIRGRLGTHGNYSRHER